MTEPTTFWRESPLRVMGSGVLQVRLAQALEHLTRLGVRVPLTGRHRKALDLLTSVNEAPTDLDPSDTDLLVRLQYAHRDAYELFLIVYAALLRSGRSNTPFTISRLRAIMSGPKLGDGTDPYPRYIQFELFVAAMLVLGSLEVRDGEPDLRLLYGAELVGVAVKRLLSLSFDQVDRNFRKGIDQVESSEFRGIVAVNLDSRFTGNPSAMSAEERIVHFEAILDSVAPIFESYRDAHPRILGYMAFGYLSEWIADPQNSNKPGLMTYAPFRWTGGPRSNGEESLFGELSDGWRSRVEAHLERISGPEPL